MNERERLEEIKKIRSRTEDEYYRLKKKNLEMADYISYKNERISQTLQLKEVYSNPKMVELYEGNADRLREFSEKEAEYRDVLEKEWRRLNEEWDEEEAALKRTIREKEETKNEERQDNIDKSN